MATISKRALSGSVMGKQIKIPLGAIVVHTAVAGAAPENNFDEIWLWAVNSAPAITVGLMVYFGAGAYPDDTIYQYLAPERGSILIVPGLILQNGTVVQGADWTIGDVILLDGFVNRISP